MKLRKKSAKDKTVRSTFHIMIVLILARDNQMDGYAMSTRATVTSTLGSDQVENRASRANTMLVTIPAAVSLSRSCRTVLGRLDGRAWAVIDIMSEFLPFLAVTHSTVVRVRRHKSHTLCRYANRA